jgi:hypothetical protein
MNVPAPEEADVFGAVGVPYLARPDRMDTVRLHHVGSGKSQYLKWRDNGPSRTRRTMPLELVEFGPVLVMPTVGALKFFIVAVRVTGRQCAPHPSMDAARLPGVLARMPSVPRPKTRSGR